jgi:hypothetical protein
VRFACDGTFQSKNGDFGTLNDPIEHLGCLLAWYIYDTYTSAGQPVYILAHSMGGLIARAAIGESGSARAGFPPAKLDVRKVVTLGTPHGGLWGFYLNQAQQFYPGAAEIEDMDSTRTGSGFMGMLNGLQRPQGWYGTSWDLIVGSTACNNQLIPPTGTAEISCHAGIPANYPFPAGDGAVQADSALAMDADLKILYGQGDCFEVAFYADKCNSTSGDDAPFSADQNMLDVSSAYSHEANSCTVILGVLGCLANPYFLNDGPAPSQSVLAYVCSGYTKCTHGQAGCSTNCTYGQAGGGGMADMAVFDSSGNPLPGQPILYSLAEIVSLLPTTLPTIAAASVATGTNPWQVSVTGSNFTPYLVARLTDGGQQWGGDIPVTFHDPGSVTFPLPSNEAPDFCNSTAPCTIQLTLYDTASVLTSATVPLTLPAYAYVITGDGVSTSYNPWAVWVTGPYFTRTLVARLTDVSGQRWGGDIPTVYGSSTNVTFQLPGNTPPSGCNINTLCAISLTLYDTTDGASSNSASLTLPESPLVVVNVSGGGQFYTKWQQYGGATGKLQDPAANWSAVGGGQQQPFAGTSCGPSGGSAIYWSSATGTFEVEGCIFQKYSGMGGPASSGFGFPTSDQTGVSSGAMSSFQGGTIYYSSASGAHYTIGGIDAKYSGMGGPNSVLGFPMTDEWYAAGGAYNFFQSGGIYWSGGTGSHDVYGAISDRYKAMGGPASSGLGFPTDDQTGVSTGAKAPFQGGTLWWSPNTAAYWTHLGIDAKYTGMGGPNSALGFPTSDEFGVAGGTMNSFQSGGIYWSGGTGVREVHGPIGSKYTGMNGPSGVLGFPMSDVYPITGGYESDFQYGVITYTYGRITVYY